MSVIERGAARDLVQIEPVVDEDPPVLLLDSPRASDTPIEELLAGFASCRHDELVVEGGRVLLEHLAPRPGSTWNDRWTMFEAATPEGPWRSVVSTAVRLTRTAHLAQALAHLIFIDAIRPSHTWMSTHSQTFWHQLATSRDAEGMRLFRESLIAQHVPRTAQAGVVCAVGQICAHTGKTVREITADDIVKQARETRAASTRAHRGGRTLFGTLHGLGWLQHPTGIYPQATKRQPAHTVEQLVDRCHIRQPQRDVWVAYLRYRSTTLDYSSLKHLAYNLVGVFWSDIQKQHPDLDTFAVTPEMLDGWRRRHAIKPNGAPRRDLLTLTIQIRGFYLDVAQWALHDAYWAPWAVACPVPRTEVVRRQKQRRQDVARIHQRTRDLAPLLPRLVEVAHQEKTRTAAELAAAQAAGHRGTVTLDGEEWTVYHEYPNASTTLRRGGQLRRISDQEAMAFWGWAAIEVLRHTGIRIEEMLELTHLSLQPYTVPATGETVPLLHIAPAKSDQERLIVASPELVGALAEILRRIRNGEAVPLTQRWDTHEHVTSDPLPHLFARRFAGELRVMAPSTIRNAIDVLCRKAGLQIAGQEARLTPHDFRRLFATEALAAGLPPHIVQVLLGHKSVATTQIYAAIYPQDVIRHHRTFITTRRQTRPSEEYREPTAAEWEEFEAYFVQRKVSLGSCGRAYGTSCQHEHACLRCGLLRPDPAQADRLRDIITNLNDRITEAEEHNWLGEVEGLKVSLAGAQSKLAQMRRQVADAEATDLGMPQMPVSGAARGREADRAGIVVRGRNR